MGQVARAKADANIRALLQTSTDAWTSAIRYRKTAIDALRLLSEGHIATAEEKRACLEQIAAVESESPVLESWRARLETLRRNYR